MYAIVAPLVSYCKYKVEASRKFANSRVFRELTRRARQSSHAFIAELVDPQRPDLRLESGRRHTEPGCRSCGSRDAAATRFQGHLDCFLLLGCGLPGNRFVVRLEGRRFEREPARI